MAKSRAPTKVDIAAYVLVRLHGDTKKVSTEAVAAKCAQIAPEHFGWSSPEFSNKGYADLEIVRRSLNGGARRKKAIVKGKASRDPEIDGWTVTDAGVAWYESNAVRIEVGIDPKLSVEQAEAADRVAMGERMAKEPLFKLFMAQGSLEDAEAEDLARMLGVSSRGPHTKIDAAFERFSIQADLAKDNEVITFARACRKKFAEILQ